MDRHQIAHLLTRVPSLIGFWAMCVCLFCYVRRRTDAAHGFIALLVPLFTFTEWDGTWARGYGLLLGFSAGAFLCWQLAADGKGRSITIPALAASLAGAVSCHYYALYVAGAIGLGELVRSARARRLDAPVIGALLVGTATLIFYFPLLSAVSAGSKAFWVSPSLTALYESYADLIGPAAIAILLFLVWTLSVPFSAHGDGAERTFLTHEIVALSALALMPISIFAASLFTPVAFYFRYTQPVVIAFAIATPGALYRLAGGNRKFRELAVLLLVWLCFTPWFAWHFIQAFGPEPWTVIRARLYLPLKAPALPMVVDQDNDFMVIYHYAPQEWRDRIYFLHDPASAIKYMGSDTGQRSMLLGQTITDLHVVDYEQFLLEHREFLLARTHANGWEIQRLLADGADLKLERLDKDRGTFVEDRLFFHVKLPSLQ